MKISFKFSLLFSVYHDEEEEEEEVDVHKKRATTDINIQIRI